MIEFFTLMCQHPGVFAMLSVFALIFIGMTYDFILRMFNRKHDKPVNPHVLDLGYDDDKDEPEEPANVPLNGPPPDELEGEEEIPEEENEEEQEYVYENPSMHLWHDWEDRVPWKVGQNKKVEEVNGR